MTVSPDGNFRRSKADEVGQEEGGKVSGEGAMGLKVLTLLGCTCSSEVIDLNGQDYLVHLKNNRLSGGYRSCSGYS